jgi:hypothetical protein
MAALPGDRPIAGCRTGSCRCDHILNSSPRPWPFGRTQADPCGALVALIGQPTSRSSLVRRSDRVGQTGACCRPLGSRGKDSADELDMTTTMPDDSPRYRTINNDAILDEENRTESFDVLGASAGSSLPDILFATTARNTLSWAAVKSWIRSPLQSIHVRVGGTSQMSAPSWRDADRRCRNRT